MVTIWNGWYWHLGLALIATSGAIATQSDCVSAQITPDGTLPNNSIVTPQGNTSIIDGGTTAGGNLFHSFEQFSVPTGGEASFNNALSIQNIISRVTGGSSSNIDGLLRANGTANLFLLNPNGIVFGPNATLNIGGSFVGSTASSINFADGRSFSATAPTSTPLLSVSVPLGLQYGANPGRIQVQGDGQGRRTTSELVDPTVGLQVQPNQTLAIVGGDIDISGGTLKTAGGRIELGSVAGPGLVNLSHVDSGWALGYEGVPTFGDIQLSGAAAVDASGAGGGDIQVQGRRVTLTNGSQIVANTLGAESGGTLSVTASDVVELIGISADEQVPSGLFTQVNPGAEGDSGDLTIATRRLTVQDGAQVSATTFGTGAAGTLSVTASDVVELIGTTTNGQFGSGLYTGADRGAEGDAGDLTIATGRLTVQGGAQVSASTSGTGAAGRLSVTADVIELIGRSDNGKIGSGLFAQVNRGEGDGGDLTIATRRLTVQGGAQVGAGTFGTGAGGRLSVTASDVIELIGIGTSADGQPPSGLYTSTSGVGKAGDLTIATGRLTVQGGAQVSASTSGTGAGGTLSVTASDVIELIGRSANSRFGSGLFTSTSGAGKAGDLTIATRRLTVQGGALVSASTLGTEAAGRLSVTASDVIELIGTSTDGKIGSGLLTSTSGAGNAGDLTIATGQLTVRDGAEVAVRSRGSGNAGSLRVDAGSVLLENQGKLRATTASGEGGNIDLQVQDLILMRSNSLISAEAEGTGNGGNITINSPFIVAAPTENNDIFVNAIQGQGGNINITTQGIYGLEYRSNLTTESDINSTSQFGVSGTVEINNPDVDPTQRLVELPAALVDASNQIANGCAAGGENKFIITKRGGLPPNPRQVLSSSAVRVEWVELDAATENRASVDRGARQRESSPSAPDNIVDVSRPVKEILEAQGWIVDTNGNFSLVATAPTAMPRGSWPPPVECPSITAQ